MSFDPSSIRRPDPSLLVYYFLVALPTLFAFPFVFIPLWVKYVTLQYKIDDEGVSMAWGFLFRREILLTYRRIQDIHVRRNIVHRWLGLSAVAIQTASGTSGAEMTIEGVREFEPLRDYLYTKMRGARGEPETVEQEEAPPDDEALVLLREIRDELRSGR
jgi:putative membrane protein